MASDPILSSYTTRAALDCCKDGSSDKDDCKDPPKGACDPADPIEVCSPILRPGDLLNRLRDRSCWDPMDPASEPPEVSIVTGHILVLGRLCLGGDASPPSDWKFHVNCKETCPPVPVVDLFSCCCPKPSGGPGAIEKRLWCVYRTAPHLFRVYSDLTLSRWVDIWEAQVIWHEPISGDCRTGVARETCTSQYRLWVVRPETLVMSRKGAFPSAGLVAPAACR